MTLKFHHFENQNSVFTVLHSAKTAQTIGKALENIGKPKEHHACMVAYLYTPPYISFY